MKHEVKHRAKALWLLAAIGFGTASLSVCCLSQEPDLLRRARFVATGDQWEFPENYTWVSASRQFCKRGYSYKRVVQAGLFWFDAKTKTVTYDRGLKALVEEYSGAELSPDHKWLLSGIIRKHDVPHQEPRFFYDLVPIHGGSTIRREIDSHFMGVKWCLDSRHWVEFTGKHVASPGSPVGINMSSQPMEIQRVAISSIDGPGRMRTIEVSPRSLLRVPGVLGSRQNPFYEMLVVGMDRFLTWTPQTYPSANIVVREISLQGAKPLHKYVLTPPRKHYLIQLIPSLDGKQFLWKLSEGIKATPAEAAEYERRTHLHYFGSSRASLWVSRIDGTGMHEIGAAPSSVNPMEYGGRTDPETGEPNENPVPRLIRWLPDGKHISFAYKRALYTVSTE